VSEDKTHRKGFW